VSNRTGGDARVPEYDLKKSNTEVWRDTDFLFSFRISSLQATSLTIPFQLLLLAVPSNQCPQHLNSSASETKQLSQLQNRHGLLLKLRLGFLSFLRRTSLLNLDKMVERQLLILRVQQLEEI
jgi:hypothetical protein